MSRFLLFIGSIVFFTGSLVGLPVRAQNWKLTRDNITRAIKESSPKLRLDTLRPSFHLTPPAGCMGDPNGGIFYDGWYHIFYGLNPFAGTYGGWYWAHARSKDLLNWENLEPGLTPAFDLGLSYVGSGSTLVDQQGNRLAFYSASTNDSMKFWRAELDQDLNTWQHPQPNPVLTLDHTGLPSFDGFWRDPFVFQTAGRTFLIACADLLEEDYVPVPIFEATDKDLTQWDYKGILFQYPKHKLRNLEVPEFRPLGDKWVFMASSDAPVDRCVYFTGDFDLDNLKFIPETEGLLDYSGHYYAQETILDDKGNLFLMAWIPGWDRDWLPTYMNEPLKLESRDWNGHFAVPRQLSIGDQGELIQRPVAAMKQLREKRFTLDPMTLPVDGPTTTIKVLDEIRGNQLEIDLELELNAASFCGINLLSNDQGIGGLFITWSGDVVNVDGTKVPIKEWSPGKRLRMRIFVDKQAVEVFINGGLYTASRQVRIENIKGDRVALTSLGGTAQLVSLEAWEMRRINR